jgi:hypothetical protein
MTDQGSESPEFQQDAPEFDEQGVGKPHDKPGDLDSDSESEEEVEIVSGSTLDKKTVNQHRKAFVKWVNDDLYPQVIKADKESPLKVYQLLVQKYLALDTPYRGLLIYHGLGTGKTASAVSLAEGLSSDLEITTLLPASLETEFVKEVRRWGLRELHQEGTWFYRSFQELSKDDKDQIKQMYNLTGQDMLKIMRKTKTAYKKKLEALASAADAEAEVKPMSLKDAEKAIKRLKGFWLPGSCPVGDPKPEEILAYEDYDPLKQECILQQINFLVAKKYNFIHYRPFPKVKTSSLKEFLEDDDDEEDEDAHLLLDEQEQKHVDTHNQAIVKKLEKRLANNKKKYDIDSPFYKQVLIVDEVHNLVRQIVNKSKPSLVFYNWIVNAKDVKIVFLSGTPVINKPCEIAILYNMLCGLIRVFSFTVKTSLTAEEMTVRLNDVIYESESPIEMFFVESKGGKLVVSFIQEQTGFESLFDPKEGDDQEGQESKKVVYTIQTGSDSFQDFIGAIYKAFSSVVPKAPIQPSKAEFDKLTKKEIKEIYRGLARTFDEEAEVVFNKQQKLFDINEEGHTLDLTDNETFMNYFFESTMGIPTKKRVLLKRMLMGMTSYYPIDRTSIVDMPQVVKPTIVEPLYRDYTIVKDMNIVPCYMSQTQFEKYYEVWLQEKKMDKFKLTSGKGIYNDDAPYHYHTRTRQTCNIVFQQDDFRIMKKTEANKQALEDEKQKVYTSLREKGSLRKDKDLAKLSPKMFEVLRNMEQFTKDGESSGKVLFYSDFRADAGSEAFELVLQSNGYERFDSKKPQETKGLRYTFITGSEAQDERRINKESFNDDKNKYGEYIQIMIISSAGAEGLSLTCVRQVHILEPYWNYVRIDQVLGRAIRMRSHMILDSKDRNVEQYLYLSILPLGTNLESVYDTVKTLDTWLIPEFEDLKAELSKTQHKELKELLDNAVNLNINEQNLSVDQYLFQVMETKYRVSQEINSVIKESALDCIPHTKDDPELNDRCIRFSSKLQGELAYFPGMSSYALETIDTKQLRATVMVHLRPNIYVVSAKDLTQNLYIYYEYTLKGNETKDDIDIRYLRENAKRLADLYDDERLLVAYATRDHPQNERLGKEFSVYQELYEVEEELYDESFPPLSEIMTPKNLKAYKLKYNIDGTFYVCEKDVLENPQKILRMYPYQSYQQQNYQCGDLRPIVLYKKELYIQDGDI